MLSSLAQTEYRHSMLPCPPSTVYAQRPFFWRATAPRVPLANRAHIDRLDAGLRSVRGAQEIISAICERRNVTKLILGHNELGDDGTTVLFQFLSSSHGRKYKIAEISLNSNEIGDEGLRAISGYLNGNRTLKELFLQNNVFTCDRDVVRMFALSINSSHLEVLSLTTNRQLSDGFVINFFPHLVAPHLRELHLSAMGLTPLSASPLASFIADRNRCYLQTLKCNGNAVGLHGVKRIIKAVERGNWALMKVELYSNRLDGFEEDDSSEADNASDAMFPGTWEGAEKRLKALLIRNQHTKKVVECEALRLLRYSRALLLHTPIDVHDCEYERERALVRYTRNPPFRFAALPTELQHHILSFLAPSLSVAQRVRIFAHASSRETLPSLKLYLPRLESVISPDPFGMGHGVGCGGGRCMGAGNNLLYKWEEERSSWLTEVDCLSYEPPQVDDSFL